MKKRLFAISICLMSVLLLAACRHSAQTGTDPSDSPAGTPSPVSASPASPSPVSPPAASPSTAPSPSAAESPSPASPSSVLNSDEASLKAYQAVLQNKLEFLSEDDNKKVYLKDFSYLVPDTSLSTVRFSVLDMDGDGLPEIVLESDNTIAYEVLHFAGGTVYGYNFVYRGMEGLKADGTFIASSGAADNWYYQLQFSGDTYSETELAHSESGSDGTISYFVGGKSVTAEEFKAFSDQQEKKDDAVWNDFTSQNIEKLLK